MGERPDGKTLDRIDGSKGYTKDNCRWATPKEQAANSKQDDRFLVLRGERKTLTEWSAITQIKVDTIRKRIDRCGWGVERALTTPARKYGNA
jgi:ABC-type phosphonate transport system ATPase subunit